MKKLIVNFLLISAVQSLFPAHTGIDNVSSLLKAHGLHSIDRNFPDAEQIEVFWQEEFNQCLKNSVAAQAYIVDSLSRGLTFSKSEIDFLKKAAADEERRKAFCTHIVTRRMVHYLVSSAAQ